jgi:photosystem II stability/assembly factor-like uncharacterized protein
MKKLILAFSFLIFFASNTQSQWIQQSTGTNNYMYSTHFENANTGWIVGNSATIRKTTNGGVNWFSQNSSQPFGSLQCVFFPDPNTGWIVGDQVYDSTIILKTTNAGNNWILQNTGGGKILYSCCFINTLTGWAIGMSTSTYSAYIMNTTTGGANWTVQQNGGTGRLLCSYFLNQSYGWAGGVNSFARTSNGGLLWEVSSPNYTAQALYFLDISTGYMAENSGKIYKTTNSGSNWFTTYNGNGTLKSIFFYDYNTGYACGVQGKILKTTNAGNNWYLQNVPVSQDNNSIYFITPMLGYAVGSGGIVVKTVNGGEVPPVTVTIHRYNINKPLSASQTTLDTINFNSFFTNGGYTRYVKITLDTIFNNVNSDLEIALVHQGITDTIAYRVGGTGNNFFNTVLNDSAAIPIENGVPPYNGEFKPSKPLSQLINLTTNGLWILKVLDRAKNLTGVIKSWSITVTYSPTIGIEPVQYTVPDRFVLFQNYPNPFNPSTNIKFHIAKNAFIKLKIFDLLGREVETLVEENLKPGIYKIPFYNTENLSSGVYFYSLFIDNQPAVSKKMVLIK